MSHATSHAPDAPYIPTRTSHSRFAPVRGLRLHLRQWGDASLVTPARAPLVLLHGWMDMGASYQFLVDALCALEGPRRWILAPDARGFGLSPAPGADGYWFPDYLGDLDALLERVWPDGPLDLLGHSMGGNVAMLYAGVRPARVRRLVNLEGFGLPRSDPAQAPRRYAQWLDELKSPPRLRPYASLDAVAARLVANDPRLTPARAAWLAPHWAQATPDGGFALRADPAHKRVNPVLYQADEALACWRQIRAPLLWVEGEHSTPEPWWGGRYTRAEFHARLDVVPRVERRCLAEAGHMLHHDQPEALAALLLRCLG